MDAKACTRCRISKPLSAFYRRSDRPSGKHSQCADCFKEQHATWRATNKESNRQRAARFRTRHPDLVKARHRDWQKANAGVLNAANATRHATKLKATPAWVDAKQIQTVYVKARQMGLVVDHVVPLQNKLVCGLHVWHNLQLLHDSDNARKKNRHWPDMP